MCHFELAFCKQACLNTVRFEKSKNKASCDLFFERVVKILESLRYASFSGMTEKELLDPSDLFFKRSLLLYSLQCTEYKVFSTK